VTARDGRPVLVVDDDEDIREALQIALFAAGLAAETAGDGDEALARLRCEPRPSLVILDLMMPRRSGADLLEALRADPELAAVPVVVLSGDHTAGASAMAAGATAFLVKPVDLVDLLATMARLGHAPPRPPSAPAGPGV